MSKQLIAYYRETSGSLREILPSTRSNTSGKGEQSEESPSVHSCFEEKKEKRTFFQENFLEK
jgi:hypothetical protein